MPKTAKRTKKSEGAAEKTKPRRKLPSALNYWKDWEIGKKGSGILVTFEPETEEIPDLRSSLPEEVIEYLCRGIEEDLFNVHREPFQNLLAATMYGLGDLARRGNRKALEDLDRLTEGLNSALKGAGGRKGYPKPEDLKKKIAENIATFKTIIEKKQKSKKSLEHIIGEISEDAEGNYHKEGRIWQIYKAYHRDCEKCLKVLADWDWKDFINFLECCRNNLDQTATLIEYRDGYFFTRKELRYRPNRKRYTGPR